MHSTLIVQPGHGSFYSTATHAGPAARSFTAPVGPSTTVQYSGTSVCTPYIAKNENRADSISKWSYPRPPFARCLASQSWHTGVWLNSMNTGLTKRARIEEMRMVKLGICTGPWYGYQNHSSIAWKTAFSKYCPNLYDQVIPISLEVRGNWSSQANEHTKVWPSVP